MGAAQGSAVLLLSSDPPKCSSVLRARQRRERGQGRPEPSLGLGPCQEARPRSVVLVGDPHLGSGRGMTMPTAVPGPREPRKEP